jgi:acylglycerol lipase
MTIQHDENIFLTTDGTEIYRQSWQPSDLLPHALVALVHGYAEHSGRYSRLATDLVDAGFAVASFDLRGHGKSSGDRCYVNNIDDYLTDLELFLTQLRHQSPNLPIFLLGHSLGGAIALRYIIEYEPNFQGLILSAPFLGQRDRAIPPSILKLLGALSRLSPKLPTITVDATQISRDPTIVQAYLNDGLVDRSKMPLRTLVTIFENIDRIKLRQQSIALPILIMHGGNDGLAGMIHSQQLYTAMSSTDKSLKLYPDSYHEIFNEPEREAIVRDLIKWLNARRSIDTDVI